MAFYNISLELQNIYMQEFSIFSKWLVFLTLCFLSAFYVFVIHRKAEKTIYWTVAISRIFFFLLSISYLIAIPISLINMNPSFTFYEFMILPLTIYGIITTILVLGFFIDLIRYGVPFLLKFANLKFDDPNVSRIVNKIKNSKFLPK